MRKIQVKYCITSIYEKAHHAGLVVLPSNDRLRANAIQRARRAYARNLADPGDCKRDGALLVGLAIAFAHVGFGAGWIPETQRIGVQIANLINGMIVPRP